jgi:phosphoglycolate phosphatase-like HAD superfamily hydrolase
VTIGVTGAIFDLDGTLADTLPVCFAAFRWAFERLGAPVYSDEQIVALFGPSEEGMMQRALPGQWQAAVTAYHEEYERCQPLLCPAAFPGIESVLELLQGRSVPIALVTGKGPHSTVMSLKHFGFDTVFDVVESGSPLGVVKADAMRRIVARWGVASDRVIYVGDADSDMQAAREAGVVPVGAAWAASARPAELTAAGASLLFTSVDDFRSWIDRTTKEFAR